MIEDRVLCAILQSSQQTEINCLTEVNININNHQVYRKLYKMKKQPSEDIGIFNNLTKS